MTPSMLFRWTASSRKQGQEFMNKHLLEKKRKKGRDGNVLEDITTNKWWECVVVWSEGVTGFIILMYDFRDSGNIIQYFKDSSSYLCTVCICRLLGRELQKNFISVARSTELLFCVWQCFCFIVNWNINFQIIQEFFNEKSFPSKTLQTMNRDDDESTNSVNTSKLSRRKPGILRLDISKPRRSSGGSVEFRMEPEIMGEVTNKTKQHNTQSHFILE